MDKFIVFTDGASRGNPGPGGYGAIVIAHENVKEIGGREAKTTNNRMELTAVIKALEFVKEWKIENCKLKIFTDSSYVLHGAKTWVHGWAKNNWKTKTKQKVENRDLWEKFLKTGRNFEIEWKLLPGHAGIPANERCDKIATAYADGLKPNLYSGGLKDYTVDIFVAPIPRKKKEEKRKKVKTAYSYVSMINGVIKIHKTWADCEKRVKGASKAKFKKATSSEDENAIIDEWKKLTLF